MSRVSSLSPVPSQVILRQIPLSHLGPLILSVISSTATNHCLANDTSLHDYTRRSFLLRLVQTAEQGPNVDALIAHCEFLQLFPTVNFFTALTLMHKRSVRDVVEAELCSMMAMPLVARYCSTSVLTSFIALLTIPIAYHSAFRQTTKKNSVKRIGAESLAPGTSQNTIKSKICYGMANESSKQLRSADGEENGFGGGYRRHERPNPNNKDAPTVPIARRKRSLYSHMGVHGDEGWESSLAKPRDDSCPSSSGGSYVDLGEVQRSIFETASDYGSYGVVGGPAVSGPRVRRAREYNGLEFSPGLGNSLPAQMPSPSLTRGHNQTTSPSLSDAVSHDSDRNRSGESGCGSRT